MVKSAQKKLGGNHKYTAKNIVQQEIQKKLCSRKFQTLGGSKKRMGGRMAEPPSKHPRW